MYDVFVGGTHVDRINGSLKDNIETVQHYMEQYIGDVVLESIMDYSLVFDNVKDTLVTTLPEFDEEDIDSIAKAISKSLIKDSPYVQC